MELPAEIASLGKDNFGSQLLELRELLAKADGARRSLEQKLGAAERQVQILQEFQKQILNSRSWRITAPLRGFRTLLGAPSPLGLQEVLLPSGDVEVREVEMEGSRGDSFIPADLPEALLVGTPDQAARSNDLCRIVELDSTLTGLLPDALLAPAANQAAGAVVSGSLYHGSDLFPPRIAFLGSSELATELAFDAVVTPLTQADWESQLGSADFDLLLLESVWHVGNRDWRNALSATGPERPSIETLLAKARDKGLPRVLWYRATALDLEHFGWLAEHVEAAYAVDSETAAALGQRQGRNVAVLAPAIQPAMHNPIRTWEQVSTTAFADKVLFDGWLDLMEGASDEALVTRFKEDRLLVAESEWEFGGVRLDDCPDFKRNAVGCLSTPGKIALAKMVGVELFRNSPLVPDWRRQTMMLRSIACGAVVTEVADGTTQWGTLPLRGEPDALGAQIQQLLQDPLARGRMRHEAFREVFSHHCLADRLNQVVEDLKLPVRFGRKPARVACLLVTMRPELLASCIERFRADRYPHKELVVVMHGRDASLAEARTLIRPGEQISIFQMGKELSLGTCLNFAAAQSDAEYWAKFDDDDLYGPNYLSDIMLYRRGIDFSVGGKSAAFIYSQADDEIRWDASYASRRSWQYRRPGRGERIHIAGGTLIGKREVLVDVPFSDVRRRGSDSDFLRRSEAAGYDFVAFDYFNFALFRSGTPGFHTWNADIDEFKQRTESVGAGEQTHSVVYA